MRLRLAILPLLLTPALAPAAGLTVHPAGVTLTGPHASQRLVVVAEDRGEATADRTASAKFTTSDPKVATVDASGVVRAAGDGQVTVSATVGPDTAKVLVTVRRAKQAAAPSFRNHVVPVLTRAGCNSGACHGALAG